MHPCPRRGREAGSQIYPEGHKGQDSRRGDKEVTREPGHQGLLKALAERPGPHAEALGAVTLSYAKGHRSWLKSLPGLSGTDPATAGVVHPSGQQGAGRLYCSPSIPWLFKGTTFWVLRNKKRPRHLPSAWGCRGRLTAFLPGEAHFTTSVPQGPASSFVYSP